MFWSRCHIVDIARTRRSPCQYKCLESQINQRLTEAIRIPSQKILSTRCVQLTATEFHEFTELLLQSFSRRALVLGLMEEQYYVIREAVTEVMWGFQQPRLVLDAQRDLLDRGISRLHWFEFPVPTGVSSLTTLTAARQENPCITCQAGKLPICTCIL